MIPAEENQDVRAARRARIAMLHDRLTVAVENLITGANWVRAIEFAAGGGGDRSATRC